MVTATSEGPIRAIHRLVMTVGIALSLLVSGCLGEGHAIRIQGAPVGSHSTPGSLHAAAAEVDITPPAGLPLYGHSSNGEMAAGYWLRLYARIIAFDDGRGRRLAMIQLDLGASSALLHRRLAAALADEGIGPSNLVMSATHTHGGPGAFFGHRFYNGFVGAKPAYEPRLVDWLVERIAGAAKEAFARLAPARLQIRQAEVASWASFNRSRGAWAKNFERDGLELPTDDVDRTLTMIRVDAQRDGRVTPIAAWSIFGVHGTAMPSSFDLYHGDVHGLAARYITGEVRRRCGVPDFVAAMANGAEGDVAPGPNVDALEHQGKWLAEQVALQIRYAADRAFGACPDPGGPLTGQDLPIRVAFHEVSMRGAGTTRGRLCQTAKLGAPQLAGSDEGRGPLYGFLGMYEGSKRPPSGCDATKIEIGGPLQALIVDTSEFPDVVPFQVVAFGDELVLATIPGEPTTEVGRAAVRAILDPRSCPTATITEATFSKAAVLGLTNGYATYFTMPEEFVEQPYEGGATLYGPYQGQLAVEELCGMAHHLEHDSAIRHRPDRVFFPGEATERFPSEPCDTEPWRAVETDPEQNAFTWRASDPEQLCPLPAIDVVCGDRTVATHRGTALEVRRDDDEWTASWTRPEALEGASCRIQVRLDDGPVLESGPLPGGAR